MIQNIYNNKMLHIFSGGLINTNHMNWGNTLARVLFIQIKEAALISDQKGCDYDRIIVNAISLSSIPFSIIQLSYLSAIH